MKFFLSLLLAFQTAAPLHANVNKEWIKDILNLVRECRSKELTPSQKLDVYVSMSKYSSHQRASAYLADCRRQIVHQVYQDPFSRDYLNLLLEIDQKSVSQPIPMADMALDLRIEWEKRYLPSVQTLLVQNNKRNASLIPVTLMAATLVLIAGRRVSLSKASLVRKYFRIASLTALGGLSFPRPAGGEGYSEEQSQYILDEHRKSGIPIDPAQLIGIKGLAGDKIESYGLTELTDLYERELVAFASSVGVSAAAISLIRMMRAAHAIRVAATTARVATATGTAAATGGIVASGGTLLVAIAVGWALSEGANFYLDQRQEKKLKGNVHDSILRIEGDLAKIQQIMNQSSTNNLNIEDLHEPSNSLYLRTRDFLDSIYHLVGYYNLPIIEATVTLAESLNKISNKYDVSIEWALEAGKAMELQQLALFMAEHPPRKTTRQRDVKKMNQKIKNAVQKFELQVANAIGNYKECTIESTESDFIENYQTGIYRETMIDYLDATLSNNGDSQMRMHYSSNFVKIQTAMSSKKSQAIDGLDYSIAKIFQRMDQDLDAYAKLQKYTLDESTLDTVQLAYLSATQKQAQTQWALKMARFDFCKNPNALLYQASQYLMKQQDILNKTILRGQIPNQYFLEDLATNLSADIRRKEAITQQILDREGVL